MHTHLLSRSVFEPLTLLGKHSHLAVWLIIFTRHLTRLLPTNQLLHKLRIFQASRSLDAFRPDDNLSVGTNLDLHFAHGPPQPNSYQARTRILTLLSARTCSLRTGSLRACNSVITLL